MYKINGIQYNTMYNRSGIYICLDVTVNVTIDICMMCSMKRQ